MSGSQTGVFHRYYDSTEQLPAFILDSDARARAASGDPVTFAHAESTSAPEHPGAQRRRLWTALRVGH